MKPTLSTEKWLELRAGTLGSSEAAAAIGEDEYVSPTELWLRKTGALPTPDIGGLRHVRMGHKLEPIILEEYAAENGATLIEDHDEVEGFLESETCEVVGWVEQRQPFIRSRAHPWRTATIDGLALSKDGKLVLLEVKAPGFRQLRHWPEDGAAAPDNYRIQVWHTLGIPKQIEHAALVAIVGGQEYREVTMHSDSVPHASLFQLEHDFMRYVWECKPPTLVGKARASHQRAMRMLHPADTGESVVLPTDMLALHVELAELKRHLEAGAEAKKRADEIKEEIAIAMGKATFGEMPDGSGTYEYRWQDRAGYTVGDKRFQTLKFKKA